MTFRWRHGAHAILMNGALNKFLDSLKATTKSTLIIISSRLHLCEKNIFHTWNDLSYYFNLIINVFESQWNNCTRLDIFNLYYILSRLLFGRVSFFMLIAHRYIDGCRFNEISFMFASLIEVALSRITLVLPLFSFRGKNQKYAFVINVLWRVHFIQ